MYMRILLVPDTSRSNANASFLLAKSLVRILRDRGHKTALCAPPYAKLRNCAFYRAPEPPSIFPFLLPAQAEAVETDLYRQKLSSYPFLRADLDALESAIKRFQPDLLLDLGRISTAIAARTQHLPRCLLISAAQYRPAHFQGKTLNGVNRLLSEEKLEQILRLETLREEADMQFMFGPATVQNMDENERRLRYGSMEAERLLQYGRKLCICFSETSLPVFRLRRILHSAFAGAYNPVLVYCKGAQGIAPTPIEYCRTIRADFLNMAQVCIHDGNPWMFNQCAVHGIPQLVFANEGWQRSRIASIFQHHGIGIVKNEKSLTMASLYENYRALINDDHYRDTCLLFAQSYQSLGDITRLVQHIEVQFSKK